MWNLLKNIWGTFQRGIFGSEECWLLVVVLQVCSKSARSDRVKIIPFCSIPLPYNNKSSDKQNRSVKIVNVQMHVTGRLESQLNLFSVTNKGANCPLSPQPLYRHNESFCIFLHFSYSFFPNLIYPYP